MEPNGILIYGELNEEQEIKTVVYELLTKARELKEKLWNQAIRVCVIGPRINYEEIINKLGSYGADDVIIVSDNRLKEYNHNYHPEIFTQIAQKFPPRMILIGATLQGKEIASYTAVKLETGLTADCTDLDIGENNLLLSTRPTFGGQLTADILCSTFPQMATIQENIFKAHSIENHSVNAIYNWIDIDKIDKRINIIKSIKKIINKHDIQNSKILVSGGAGACQNNGFALIYQLAQKLKAQVCGSREAREKGFITKAQQVGQTGKIVSPDIYIAIGISGANQHLTGIKNSGKIIAVNKDKNAPIFNYSDIGIVGDLFEILPELIRSLDNIEEKNDQ